MEKKSGGKKNAKKVSKSKKNVSNKKSDLKYLCPKCKSKNVSKVFSLRTFFGIIPRWKCSSCGLEEMVFPRVVGK